MRLLNVYDGRIEEYIGRERPKYAILSHTWNEDEITFSEMVDGLITTHETPSGLVGIQEWQAERPVHAFYRGMPVLAFYKPFIVERKAFAKIQYCCNQARRDGFDYVWIDSCCIDKTSSSELSEAINSMFKWYKEAEVCYTYLEDVDSVNDAFSPHLPACKWLGRSWTLQELVAPSAVRFFSQDWRLLGTRDEFCQRLSKATGIHESILRDNRSKLGSATIEDKLRRTSVAQRMSWASYRRSTRLEDVAYSLLGIFDIQMPLLYGEGDKAFTRLQEEIVKSIDDDSLFAWSALDLEQSSSLGLGKHRNWSAQGWFAPSPLYFGNASNIVPIRGKVRATPIVSTQLGLRIDMPLVHRTTNEVNRDFLFSNTSYCYAALNCQFTNDPLTCIGIWLRGNRGVYVRQLEQFVPSHGQRTEWRNLRHWGRSIRRMTHDEVKDSDQTTIVILKDSIQLDAYASSLLDTLPIYMDLVELWTYDIRLMTKLDPYEWKSSCYLIHLSHRDPSIAIKLMLHQDQDAENKILSLMLSWDSSGFSVWFRSGTPVLDDNLETDRTERYYSSCSFVDTGIHAVQDGLNDLMLGANRSLHNVPRQTNEALRVPRPTRITNTITANVTRWIEPQLRLEELFGSLVVFLTFKVRTDIPSPKDVPHVRIERDIHKA